MAENPLKVVLDTNVLISALIFGGKPETVYRLAIEKRITAFISPFIIAEAIEVLAKKFNFSQVKLKQVKGKLRKNFKVLNTTKIINIVRDKDDNKILEAAAEGGCEFIITGDMDLLSLGKYKQIKILTAEQFLSLKLEL